MKYRYETTDASTYQLLLEKAHEMRKCPTEAEAVLWNYLSGDKLGVHFRRQHPIYGYIPDFVCINQKLVIEIDGGYHLEGEQPEKDAERTSYLNQAGYVVLRFTNDEVIGNIDDVLEEIADALEDQQSNQTSLPLGGAGGGSVSFGLLGHSDADVLIHAICDAMLGAANMRDIGYHFPDTAAETDGMDSKIILEKTVELIATKGYRFVNLDATICAERPKMNPHIPAMQQCLADIIGTDPDNVSIKATTTEHLGFTGREEGMSAYAVVLIEKVV